MGRSEQTEKARNAPMLSVPTTGSVPQCASRAKAAAARLIQSDVRSWPEAALDPPDRRLITVLRNREQHWPARAGIPFLLVSHDGWRFLDGDEPLPEEAWIRLSALSRLRRRIAGGPPSPCASMRAEEGG